MPGHRIQNGLETRLGEVRSWRARDVAPKKKAWVCVFKYQDRAGGANRCLGLGTREMVDSVANQSALESSKEASPYFSQESLGENTELALLDVPIVEEKTDPWVLVSPFVNVGDEFKGKTQ